MAEETKKQDSERETEVSLLDLIIVLLKYKWVILALILLAAILGFAYVGISIKQNEVKNLPSQTESVIYYSECLIEPDSGVREKINVLLFRPNFVMKIMEGNHLLNDLQQAIISERRNEEITSEKPSAQEVANWLKQNLFQTPTGSFLTIGFSSREKDLPPKIINAFLSSISEYFRRRDLEIFTKKENLLRRHLAASHDPFLKDRIAIEIINLIERKTKAENQKYYGFELVDPPSIIERVKVSLKGSGKKIEPLENVSVSFQTPPARGAKYTMIIILLILAAFVVGVSLAFFMEYIHKMKTRETEKIALLKRYLCIRGK